MIFGTFDILHPGHIALFKQARGYGDHLTVVLARDVTVRKVKGSLPLHDEKQRREILAHIDLIDRVVMGDTDNAYRIIKRVRPRVIALGYDQTAFVDRLEEQLKEFKLPAKIVRLKPHRENKHKTHKIKRLLAQQL